MSASVGFRSAASSLTAPGSFVNSRSIPGLVSWSEAESGAETGLLARALSTGGSGFGAGRTRASEGSVRLPASLRGKRWLATCGPHAWVNTTVANQPARRTIVADFARTLRLCAICAQIFAESMASAQRISRSTAGKACQLQRLVGQPPSFKASDPLKQIARLALKPTARVPRNRDEGLVRGAMIDPRSFNPWTD